MLSNEMKDKSFITIVMYHYVRDLSRSRYPGLKALQIEKFEQQLGRFLEQYSICSFAQVIASVRHGEELPPSACVLTFDDGLADHFEVVFPRLMDRGLIAAFFPPARPLQDGGLLDVHKVQFVLATMTRHDDLANELTIEI
jgi:hypothetical protein